ncbi:N-acetyl-anhydromuranmyl-L-alanine amidase [Thalassotalea insulae]|uniref:1,6-anhydro-N-acetylmuramyl-L-alanine amidase AmpD n=1 Tax=Thalassotalea insulae TaxID=2056778 RepID=A0ABQ6GSZ4_9GAMM|nr:1,6-anhydro-N-acetylmuramyl-L-alanine amidase AmpD [Thalassotalea insulae]GLX77777.1 N-acetyl-anhydromuranmyl-L-alanine amidase [Thalassotalea insulae]
MTTDANHSNLSQIKAKFHLVDGWLTEVTKCPSPHYDQREQCQKGQIDLLVIHNISLPAGKFGLPYITDLFLGQLDPAADPSFEDIYQLRVSAHCLIRRDGHIIQYVSFNDRAWHAGVSNYQGREKCNDFSIGIELEGSDDIPYTEEQYQQLSALTQALKYHYPKISDNIVGHCDIAPERKTDPGDAFNWGYYRRLLQSH